MQFLLIFMVAAVSVKFFDSGSVNLGTGVTAPNPLPCREHLTALQWVEHRCYMRRLQSQKRWQCEYVKMRRTQPLPQRSEATTKGFNRSRTWDLSPTQKR